NSEEAAVVQQPAERRLAEMALTNMFVTIDARIERFQRIVEMKGGEAPKPDMLVQFSEGTFIAFAAAQVVAGGECVLGIEAEPQTLVLFHRVEDTPHLLKRIAEIAALARGYFQREFRTEPGARLMRLVDRTGDAGDSGLLACADVGSRM